jgi:hypothetical protein
MNLVKRYMRNVISSDGPLYALLKLLTNDLRIETLVRPLLDFGVHQGDACRFRPIDSGLCGREWQMPVVDRGKVIAFPAPTRKARLRVNHARRAMFSTFSVHLLE